MTTTAATTPTSRERRDPLSKSEIEATLRLLASVTAALRTALTGRPIHGSDAPLIREACHRLGSILAALAHDAGES